MNTRSLSLAVIISGLFSNALPTEAASWATVVNNSVRAPGSADNNFYSYNQPSVNSKGLVVFRARAKNPTPGGEGVGGSIGSIEGGPTRGVFTRDMVRLTSIATIASNKQPFNVVPEPNNTLQPGPATFNEFPSFPRIDKSSGTTSFRGQSTPSWEVPDLGKVGGTSGLYLGLAGNLKTGVRNIEASYFPEYLVPQSALPVGALPTRFDQFPGAPSPMVNLVAFKGNYTTTSGSKTGVFYRNLSKNHSNNPVLMIANSETTCIPGTNPCIKFGSTSPPSATENKVVFVGLDNEENPKIGGIYLSQLKGSSESEDPSESEDRSESQARSELDDDKPGTSKKKLETLVGLGKTNVPGFDGQPLEGKPTFTRFGEALSFDGRYVAFWGAWGTESKLLKLTCPTEGEKSVIQYCNQYENNKEVLIPVNQGFFVHDIKSGTTKMAARTSSRNDDFLYWNFSGRPPGVGAGEITEDFEEPRWRSTSFVALDAGRVAYKARSGVLEVSGLWNTPVDGIYLKNTAGKSNALVATLVDTTMPGINVDPTAPSNSTISSIGIERDGFRNGWLAINASMVVFNDETEGWGGIYLTRP